MNKAKFVEAVFDKLLDDEDRELLEAIVNEKEMGDSTEKATNEKILDTIMKKQNK